MDEHKDSMRSVAELQRRSKTIRRGTYFEEFSVGETFEHRRGKTLQASENSTFSTLTLSYNPIYLDEEVAHAEGHEGTVVNPMLVFNTAFGLSVEDLSELGGAFLGVDDLVFHDHVLVGSTLTAHSKVVEKRESTKYEDLGIVTWHTEGLVGKDKCVVEFMRTNLVARKPK